MKNAKKLLALLLAMVMLFALCACSGNGAKEDEKEKKPTASQGAGRPSKNNEPNSGEDPAIDEDELDVEGEWEMTIAPYAFGIDEENLTMSGYTYDEDIVMDVEFDEDGYMTVGIDGYIEWCEGFVYGLLEWVEDGDNVYQFIADMSEEDVDDFMADCEAEGITKDDLVEMFEEEFAADELLESLIAEWGDEEDMIADYAIDEEALYIDDGDVIWYYTYSRGKIYIEEIESDDETIFLDKGDFVLKR